MIMALILKEEDVKEYLEKEGMLNSFTEDTIVYAQILPSTAQFFILGASAQLVKGNYFAMCIDKNQIILIQLSKITGKINQKVEPMIIPFDEINSVHIKDGLLLYTITFQGEEGEKLSLKLSKKAVGMQWHKNNLEPVLQRLRNL